MVHPNDLSKFLRPVAEVDPMPPACALIRVVQIEGFFGFRPFVNQFQA